MDSTPIIAASLNRAFPATRLSHAAGRQRHIDSPTQAKSTADSSQAAPTVADAGTYSVDTTSSTTSLADDYAALGKALAAGDIAAAKLIFERMKHHDQGLAPAQNKNTPGPLGAPSGTPGAADSTAAGNMDSVLNIQV